MHTAYNTNCSVVDLQNMRLDTHVGRAEIRAQLENGWRVPPEIIGWFFEAIDKAIDEAIDQRQLIIPNLEQTLKEEGIQ